MVLIVTATGEPAMKNSNVLTRTRTLKLMKSLAFFRFFSNEELELLIDHQDIIRYRANETIIQEGAEEQSFFIILKGRVGINKKMHPSPLSRHLSELETGQCFGEMAVITGRPRSATVVALEETYVFRADPEMLNASIDDPVLLRIESKIYKSLACALADKIDAYNLRNITIL